MDGPGWFHQVEGTGRCPSQCFLGMQRMGGTGYSSLGRLDWLRSSSGNKWLRSEDGSIWLNSQKGRHWLQSKSRKHWLSILKCDMMIPNDDDSQKNLDVLLAILDREA